MSSSPESEKTEQVAARPAEQPRLVTAGLSRLRARLEAWTPEQEAAAQKAKAEQEARREASEVNQCLAKIGLGPRYSLERCTLTTFRADNPEQKRVVDLLRGLDLQKLTSEGRGLFFYGPVGTGKDHLAAALLYQLAAKRVSVRWVRCLDLFGSLRDRMDGGKEEEWFLQNLAEPSVLCLSDPASAIGDLSSWRIEFLHRLVDRRYCNLKPTWVTTNAPNPQEAEGQLSSQVFDRLQEGAVMIHCLWPSHRERK